MFKKLVNASVIRSYKVRVMNMHNEPKTDARKKIFIVDYFVLLIQPRSTSAVLPVSFLPSTN
jgi:hypothetical protein